MYIIAFTGEILQNGVLPCTFSLLHIQCCSDGSLIVYTKQVKLVAGSCPLAAEFDMLDLHHGNRNEANKNLIH